MSFADFQFLRLDWFWAVIPAILLGAMLLRGRADGGSHEWAKHVDRHLLAHLGIGGAVAKRSRAVPYGAGLMVAATIFGLAGPTWQERTVPSFEGGTPVVAVLSLAQSMNADDLTPSRLTRSVHKLRDILDRTEGDQRGLVIYSDAPFAAAPLTRDPEIIEQMLPEFSTSLMPVLGDRLDKAITEAQDLLERAGAVRGDIVVMADNAGQDPQASIAAARAAADEGYTVSVLGAGTVEGAILQTAAGRAITGESGETYTTKLGKDGLEQVAKAGGGTFAMITSNGADLDKILPKRDTSSAGAEQDFQGDSHVDMGYLLLVIPVLLLPFAFRRGLVLSFVLVGFGLFSQPGTAQAGTWDSLWLTPDQQGQAAFDAKDFVGAEAAFDDPAWKGAAAYRGGDYTAAAAGFMGSAYNLGNVLAKSGQFEEALAAYDNALSANPNDDDAQFNRDLIADLLEQQQQQQDQQSEEKQSGDQQSEDQQQSGDKDQQQGDQQSQAGEDQSQAGDQEGQEPQSGDASQQADAQDSDAQGDPSQEQDPQDQGQDGEKQQAQDQGDTPSDQAGDPSDQNSQPENQQTAEDQAGEEQSLEDQAAAGENAQDETEDGLSQMLSDLLGQSTDATQDQSEDAVQASAPGQQPVDQAIEQQLRRVPDDPSGLLRARIRQHYARLRQGG